MYHLQRDLEQLQRDILSMSAIAEQAVYHAVRALRERDVQLAERVIAGDEEVDRWDVRIDEEALKLLALHQPVAIDLRRVTMVMRITGELERVADLAVNIAERAAALAASPEVAMPDRLDRMADLALDMVRRSLDAFVHLDVERARNVIFDDDEVDQLNREIIEELQQRMRREPELIPPCMQMFSASRHVERIADHATNIAEDVIYLVEGRIVRHQAEKLSREE